jgi:hypothetical protein
MNEINIIVQSKDDPKNLLSTAEKAEGFPDGTTIVFMEAATKSGQLGIEFIMKGQDIFGNKTIMGFQLTENNMEALSGAFIGVRMRFGRMPADQWELVRHYVKQKAQAFLQSLPPDKQKAFGMDVRKFFGLSS